MDLDVVVGEDQLWGHPHHVWLSWHPGGVVAALPRGCDRTLRGDVGVSRALPFPLMR